MTREYALDARIRCTPSRRSGGRDVQHVDGEALAYLVVVAADNGVTVGELHREESVKRPIEGAEDRDGGVASRGTRWPASRPSATSTSPSTASGSSELIPAKPQARLSP